MDIPIFYITYCNFFDTILKDHISFQMQPVQNLMDLTIYKKQSLLFLRKKRRDSTIIKSLHY